VFLRIFIVWFKLSPFVLGFLAMGLHYGTHSSGQTCFCSPRIRAIASSKLYL
jgi:hypothetical protein